MNDPIAMLASALGDEEAARLGPSLSTATLSDGETLYVQGEPSGWLVLVVDGWVDVEQRAGGGSTRIGTRGPGAWLGDIGFVDGGPATATVRARGPVRFVAVATHGMLVEMTRERPETAGALLRHLNRQMAERLAATSSGIVERLGPGQDVVHAPDEVRGWVTELLKRAFGAREEQP